MTAAASTSLFTLSQVSLGPKRLVDVTATIQPGITAVLGASGAGKTSLLNVLAAFERPSAGRIESPAKVFWVPQDGGLWPGMTVHEHLATMTRNQSAIADMLSAFELTEQAKQVPATLSRGQQSRLTVARALLADCSAIIMDEPLAHIDTNRRSRFWEAIRNSITERGQSLIFATHEPELVLGEAAHVVCMRAGKVFSSISVPDLYWHAPSEEHAAFLGPVNWISAAIRETWFSPDSTDIQPCLRPEQLQVRLDSAGGCDSPIAVIDVRFRGSHEELTLHHNAINETRTFWHRPSKPELKPGNQITLEKRSD
ncbi:MAG: ATP-binding cassette domain-containing protein [Verrucomicrobiales bacterium]